MKRGRSTARERANRMNALKSTGPRTPQGKARSSRNALRHGLRSMSDFDPPQVDELAATFAPASGDPIVFMLARQIARADLEIMLARRLRHLLLAQTVACEQRARWRDKRLFCGILKERLAAGPFLQRHLDLARPRESLDEHPLGANVTRKARLLLAYEMRAMGRRRMLLRRMNNLQLLLLPNEPNVV